MKLKGITVLIHIKTQTGTDDFGMPIYDESTEEVENVLVAPVSADDVISQTDLKTKKAVYTLAIPKGDTHKWEDTIVEFFDKSWSTVGVPVKGIEEQIPLDWNMKVTVEKYE